MLAIATANLAKPSTGSVEVLDIRIARVVFNANLRGTNPGRVVNIDRDRHATGMMPDEFVGDLNGLQ